MTDVKATACLLMLFTRPSSVSHSSIITIIGWFQANTSIIAKGKSLERAEEFFWFEAMHKFSFGVISLFMPLM